MYSWLFNQEEESLSGISNTLKLRSMIKSRKKLCHRKYMEILAKGKKVK